MKVFEILNTVEGLKYRDKWHKGVKVYAVEMLKKLCNGDQEDVDKFTNFEDLRIIHVTHHSDGSQFTLANRSKEAKDIVARACYGAMFLVSNEDIANRLYTKREKACHYKLENAMEAQIKAVWWAIGLIWRIASGQNYMNY